MKLISSIQILCQSSNGDFRELATSHLSRHDNHFLIVFDTYSYHHNHTGKCGTAVTVSAHILLQYGSLEVIYVFLLLYIMLVIPNLFLGLMGGQMQRGD